MWRFLFKKVNITVLDSVNDVSAVEAVFLLKVHTTRRTVDGCVLRVFLSGEFEKYCDIKNTSSKMHNKQNEC